MIMKKYIATLYFIAFSFQLTYAQTSNELEKQARTYIQDHEYNKARPLLIKLLERNPNDFFATFERSRLLFMWEQTERYKVRGRQFRFTNFQSFFDTLHVAHQLSLKSKELYQSLSNDEKTTTRWRVAATEDEIVRANSHNIENEAFKLIESAPYRKKTTFLYSSGVYNRVKDADEVLKLREALLEQCGQFLEQYPKSMYVKTVANYRKEMLSEYINIADLRRYGERDGKMYEKYCHSILQLYSLEELKFIVPKFYGAEYSIEKLYDKSEEYSKLKALASTRRQEAIELLCDLNLHFEGYTPEKESLYQQFIEALAPHDIARIAVQKKAAYYVNKQDWETASQIVASYSYLFPQWSDFFTKTVQLIRDDAPPRRLVNLGSSINTLAHDYNPVMTADGNTLYFARKNADTGEDIYYTKKIDGAWQPARRVTNNVSTSTHEVPVNISADAKSLIIYGNYSTLPEFNYVNLLERNLGKGDLYYSQKQGDNWGKIKVFPTPINTRHYETGLAFTADESAVLFSSDRPGGVGGYKPNYPPDKLYYHGAGEFNLDLYVVEKTANGWGEPINLGEVINTPFAEKSPYLHPDMKTLYFSSDGHYGLGGYDIYMTQRLSMDSWTEWSEPVNIGKAINSPYDDTFYLTATGDKALMVSSREGNSYGQRDIYMVEIPEEYQPEPITLVQGQFTNTNGEGTPTHIAWHEKENKENGGKIKTDREGNYSIFLKNGKKYVLYAENDKKFGNSVMLDLSTSAKSGYIAAESTELSSIDKNDPNRKPIILKTLHFDHDSDVIRPESYFDLNRLVTLLQTHSDLYIRIEGHTDSDGDDDFNFNLSNRRAKAVEAYLIQQGVGNKVKGAEGFGESRPRAENTTEVGQQLNRRVEFIILD